MYSVISLAFLNYWKFETSRRVKSDHNIIKLLQQRRKHEDKFKIYVCGSNGCNFFCSSFCILPKSIEAAVGIPKGKARRSCSNCIICSASTKNFVTQFGKKWKTYLEFDESCFHKLSRPDKQPQMWGVQEVPM